MQKLLLLLLMSMVFTRAGEAQKVLDPPENKPTIHYDHHQIEVSKQKFNRLYRSKRKTHTYGDSATVRRLVTRATTGQLENRDGFLQHLAEGLGRPVPDDRPTVIIFYPGFDECNGTGTSDRYRIKQWHDELENGLQEIAGIQPLYLYKDNYGLRKYYNIINWLEDPDHLVEQQFFRYHYPCRSVVVIGTDGKYQSYFGGFSKDRVWEMARTVLR